MAAIILSLCGLSRRVVQQIPQGIPVSLAKFRKDSWCHLRILLDQRPYEFADAGRADENRACDAVAFDDEQTMLVGALLRRTDDLLGVASWLRQPDPLISDAAVMPAVPLPMMTTFEMPDSKPRSTSGCCSSGSGRSRGFILVSTTTPPRSGRHTHAIRALPSRPSRRNVAISSSVGLLRASPPSTMAMGSAPHIPMRQPKSMLTPTDSMPCNNDLCGSAGKLRPEPRSTTRFSASARPAPRNTPASTVTRGSDAAGAVACLNSCSARNPLKTTASAKMATANRNAWLLHAGNVSPLSLESVERTIGAANQ